MNKKLIRFLSVALAIVMLFSLCSCDTYEEEDEKIKYASEVPSGKEAIVARFNDVIAAAKSGKPAISYSLKQGAGGCDCENQYIKASFKTVSKMITNEKFGMSTAYGEATTDIFPLMGTENPAVLSVADIRSAFITDNANDTNYTILIKINPEKNPEQGNGVYGKLYQINKDEDILKNFDIVKDFMTADGYSATYGIGTIKAVINKTTDSLVKLELSRDVRVETEVTGQGTLESVGTVPLAFNYNSTANYDLDWDNPATDDIEA